MRKCLTVDNLRLLLDRIDLEHVLHTLVRDRRCLFIDISDIVNRHDI